MDPYANNSKPKRTRNKRRSDAFWDAFMRLEDHFGLVYDEAERKYEACEPVTKWYEIFWYAIFWLGDRYIALCEYLAGANPTRSWEKRKQAKRDREREERHQRYDREFAREDAIERENIRVREEIRVREIYDAPKPEPLPLTLAEKAAEAKARKKRLDQIAERDWYARNRRLMDAKYWDDPNDPKRWWNPPFPG